MIPHGLKNNIEKLEKKYIINQQEKRGKPKQNKGEKKGEEAKD